MKAILRKILILSLLMISATFLGLGCSGNPSTKDFTTINFSSVSIDYDGEEHTIVATGVPEGASVVYTNAGPFVAPGTYQIGVEITAEGYNTYSKTATLTINGLTFNSIIFESQTIDYDGNEHTLVALGVPEDASVVYTNEGPFVLPGIYQIGVEVSAEGYNTYSKIATLTINALDFTSIEFNGKTLDYDGAEHTIFATGMPDGASVVYTNEGPYVNAGEYNISVIISREGYNTYTKTVKLKINKIDFPSTIIFDDTKEFYTGSEKTILVSGDLPEGTKVEYTNNKGTNEGKYDAKAVLTNPNYNTKTLYATMTIYDILNTAKKTIDTLLDRPDPWAFMPSAFSKASIANKTSPVKDFTNFVKVGDINKKFMGKQMYVLWEGVDGMETMLEKFDVVFAIGETIASAYQNFINDNPEDYNEWSTNLAGFKIKIALDGAKSTILVGNSVFSLELNADTDKNVNKGRIEIAAGGILNYEMKDDYLKFNIALTIKGVLIMKQVEFVRGTDGSVAGYFYEYTGLKSAALKTSAVIGFNSQYAIVTSAKRESEDLLIKGYEEVYSATTGQFISAEVLETNGFIDVLGTSDFDTFWVNLYDVSGITEVKAIRNSEVSLSKNLHDIYINGSSEILKARRNRLIVETSRKFDIEMKTVYYVVATSENGQVSYSIEETEIPMLFVQKKNIDDFSSNIVEDNKNTFKVTPTLPTAKMKIAEDNFEASYELLTVIKESLTYDELESQLGTRNSFFN